MPQQYGIINNHIKDQNKTDKPKLDGAALNDLNNVLAEKIFYNPITTIKYWDNGYYNVIQCEVNKFDSERNKIEVIENGEVVRLNMDCIVEIE